MDTATQTPLKTKKALHEAVSAIASKCDGANSQDGVGFNGSDTKFGLRASLITPDMWTDDISWEVYTMLQTYKGQLEKYGHPFETLPLPQKGDFNGRDQARSLAKALEYIVSRNIDFNGEQFVITFRYDSSVVNAVRQIEGAKWNPQQKEWKAPASSAPGVVSFAEQFEFSFSKPAEDQVKGVKPKKVQKRKAKRRLYMEGSSLIFECGTNEHLIFAIKQIRGRTWDSKRKLWIAPSTSMEQALDVAHVWDFEMDPSLVTKADEIVHKQHVRAAASEAQNADLVVEGLNTKHPVTGQELKLRPFQKAGVAYAVETKRCFIADEMGLGKTVQALASVQFEKAYPCLVVCPASLKMNWEREVRMWLPGKTVHIVDNKVGVKNADVIVINYDILSKQKDALGKVGFNSLIFDESHYAKNSSAQRTKALKHLAKSIPSTGMVLALTGTPVLNRPVELVSQLEILDRIEDFGGSWHFRQRYCAASHNGHGWDFKGASNEEELNNLLRSTCYVRRNKADVLKELPAKGRYTVDVELSPASRKIYRNTENEVLIGLQAQTSVNQLGQLMTLKRLAGEAKVEAACDWIDTFLDSTDRKLVVFAHHISVVDGIANKYGGVRVAGKDTQQARQDAVDKFQSDPECRVIVLNMKAGGVGLTLTAASDVLFVEQGWSPADHDQAEDRCHRIGQDETVSAWYLLANETIDQDVYRLISDKRLIVDAVTDGDETSGDSILNELVKTLVARTR